VTFWRVESIEGGQPKPNGRFTLESEARAWAEELAQVREAVLVWRCTKERGAVEERTLVLRFQRPEVEIGKRRGFRRGSGGG
jgi:hypothetical protein